MAFNRFLHQSLQLGITQSTLSRLLVNREKIKEDSASNVNPKRKRKRDGKDIAVENALLQWFTNVRTQNVPISRGILMEKAASFPSKLGHEIFKPTDGWLSRWKDRNMIVYKKLHGEIKDADSPAAENWIKTALPELLRDYKPDEIYNTDETGLYFRAIPDYSLVFKNESHAAGKNQKERITVLVTCNMYSTDKQKLLVIGKSRNPRCFRGASLPVTYKSNSNAWMTSEIFRQWLTEWDQKLKDRKIALLLDNCTAHPNVVLKNIKLVFLPANTTSLIQPLDQGIIKTLKTLYRQDMRNFIIRMIEDEENQIQAKDVAKTISLLTAIHMIQKAWENVRCSTIVNCFKKASFVVHGGALSSGENNDPAAIDGLDDELRNWVNMDEDLPGVERDSEENIVTSLSTNEHVQAADETEEIDENNSAPPSAKEIHTALEVLRRNLDIRGATSEEFRCFYRLEDIVNSKIPMRQTTILSFIDKT